MFTIRKNYQFAAFCEDLLIVQFSVFDSQITPIIILYNFLQSGGRFWIFTFFGNSDSAVHPHPYVNFFILSLTLSLSSHLFSSPLLSPHFPIHPTHPSSLTLLLFKYPPSLHSRSFPLFPPFTYPQLINSFSSS